MALIKCPECGKEISSEAKACPNCGKPLKKYASKPGVKRNKKPWYKEWKIWGIVIIAIIICLAVISIIVAHNNLSKVVEDAFYQSGKGGVPITDIADNFEDQMKTYYK